MTPSLVIFDCDGVLVDSEPITDRVIVANLARHGLTLREDEVSEMFLGGTLKGVGEKATEMGAVLPKGWLDDIYAETFAALGKGVPVFDGVFDLLDKLEGQGIATAIASNGPMAKMATTLTPSGLITRFTGRMYSGHDFTPKPDPAMIRHAMQMAGATPAKTVFIDDSVNGASAGIAAGVRVLGFAPAGDDGRLQAIGAEPVRAMAEVAELLGL